jgi:polysaccharide biosynthesis/export protein
MRALLCMTVWGVAGCAASLPQVPLVPTDDPEFSEPQLVVPPGLDDDEPLSLTLEPGDVITIRAHSDEVREYEELMVDERGIVHVPLAGPVEVGGMPLEEAESRVEQAMRAFDRVVRINILLAEPTGHQATVLGAVSEPGRVPLLPGMRVADMVASVGGPVHDASGGEVVFLADLDLARLVRGGETLPVSIRLALEGDPRHNVRVRPGDYLYMPPVRGRSIIVLGEVGDPRLVAYRSDLRLTEVLAVSGGLTQEGDRTDIHVVRGPLRAPRVYRANLRHIVDGKSGDVILAPGDIVYVTQEWTAGVGEVLSRLSPVLTVGAMAGMTYILVN